MTNLFSDNDLTRYPDHIYYDLIISNSHSINEDEPHLKFNEKRTTSLIEKPEKYKMTIARFMCDTHVLPIMQPTIMAQSDQINLFPNNTNHHRTVYSITVQIGDAAIQKYIEFIPQDTTASKPVEFKSNGSPNYETSYYDIFLYDHFISMCNQTMKSIFQYAFSSTQALPTFTYSPSSGKVSFQAPSENFNSTVDGDYHIYLNTALYRLFNSLPATYLDKKDIKGRNFKLDTDNFSNNISTLINYNDSLGAVINPSGKDFLVTSQEYSTVANWSPVASIAFTSNTLNVVGSSISSLHEYVNGREVVEGSANNSILMITDIASPSNYLPGIYYAANPYRWVDLQDSGPIRDINVEVYWISKRAELNPFKLAAGGSCSMKMLFKKV